MLCTESIRDEKDRKHVIDEITSPKKNIKAKELIEINYDEMENMGGNMIMLQNSVGEHCVIMSERARRGMRRHNLEALETAYTVISADLTMIELIGGGSARCMIAELF